MESPANNLVPPGCQRKYRPERLLGSGGFASVYLATQVSLERPVVVKVLHAETLKATEHRNRFLAEAKLTATLAHPHIVVVIDHGVEDGTPWVVFEYLPGKSLRDLLMKGSFTLREAVSVAAQVAAALELAHAHGVIHRDIKPENVLAAPEGAFKVTDFGIAKWATTSAMTRTGAVLGSPAYLAPEVIQGQTVAASDQYGLGVMLYEMVTGQLPFDHPNMATLLAMQLRNDPRPPHELCPEMPEALERVILRALEKVPTDRFPSMRIMKEQLEDLRGEVGDAQPPRTGRPTARSKATTIARLTVIARPRSTATMGWLVALGGLLVVLALTASAWRPTAPPPRTSSPAPRVQTPSPQPTVLIQVTRLWIRYHERTLIKGRRMAFELGEKGTPLPLHLRPLRRIHEELAEQVEDLQRATPMLRTPAGRSTDQALRAALLMRFMCYRLAIDVRNLAAAAGSDSSDAFRQLRSTWVNDTRTVRDAELFLETAAEAVELLAVPPQGQHGNLLVSLSLIYDVYCGYDYAQVYWKRARSLMGPVLNAFIKRVKKQEATAPKHLIELLEELDFAVKNRPYRPYHLGRAKNELKSYYKHWPHTDKHREVLAPMIRTLEAALLDRTAPDGAVPPE